MSDKKPLSVIFDDTEYTLDELKTFASGKKSIIGNGVILSLIEKIEAQDIELDELRELADDARDESLFNDKD